MECPSPDGRIALAIIGKQEIAPNSLYEYYSFDGIHLRLDP
jgi:hypothetical protein